VSARVVPWAYGAVLAMGIVFGALSLVQLRRTTQELERVLSQPAETVILVERLRATSERQGMAMRSYLLTQSPRFLRESRAAGDEMVAQLDALALRIAWTPSVPILARIRRLHAQGQSTMERLFAMRGALPWQETLDELEQRGQPLRDQVGALLDELSRTERRDLRGAALEASVAATRARQLLSVTAVLALLAAAGLTVALARTLRLLGRSRAALEASMTRLEAVNRDLDAFAGRIAHDLRNVLAPLDPLAATLARRAGDVEATARAATRLRRLGGKAEGLIGALLAFARAGAPTDPQAAARVGEVTREVIEDLAGVAAERGAQVTVDVDDAVAVLCAPSLLHTVLLNLVGNALKYLDGERREVHVAARRADGGAEIAVTDTGPGIPLEAQGSIFKPFYRVPGVAAPGTGIGLATVSRIVQAHGGALAVRSRPGEGSTFTVRLPAAPTRAGDGPSAGAVGPTGGPPPAAPAAGETAPTG
jgi:signal transduction histidine kinase